MVAFLQVGRVTKREASLRPATVIMLLAAVLWACSAIFGIVYYVEMGNEYDGTLHERDARHVANQIRESSFGFSDMLVLGNNGYQNLLGVFYAFTGISPWAIYGINAVLGFSGTLFVLEAICRHFRAVRCPTWLVLLALFSPSLALWAPKNLKEGLLIWSIGLIVSWFLNKRDSKRHFTDHAALVVGAITLFFLRPHTAAAWLGGMALGTMRPAHSIAKTVAAGLAFVAMSVGALVGVNYIRPGFYSSLTEQGLTETLNEGYQSSNSLGNTAIYRQENPIPVVTGLMIATLAPPPNFWGSPPWLILGLESLARSMAVFFGWTLFSVGFGRLLREPNVRGAIFVILLFSLYLSYSYNMGLAVRLMIQLVPAILILAAAPAILRQRN
jgi:hypothetical protein